MNGFRIYVAGPYSSDPLANTQTAIAYGNRLLELGYAPFIPHLSHFWHELFDHDYEEWLDYGLEWVKVCDAILRLPGESNGADFETELAAGIDVPVYHSIEELHAAFMEQL